MSTSRYRGRPTVRLHLRSPKHLTQTGFLGRPGSPKSDKKGNSCTCTCLSTVHNSSKCQGNLLWVQFLPELNTVVEWVIGRGVNEILQRPCLRTPMTCLSEQSWSMQCAVLSTLDACTALGKAIAAKAACSHRGTTSKLQWPMQFMMSKKVKYIGIWGQPSCLLLSTEPEDTDQELRNNLNVLV